MTSLPIWKFLGMYELHYKPDIKSEDTQTLKNIASKYIRILFTLVPALSFMIMLGTTASDMLKSNIKNPGIVIVLSLNFTSLLLVAIVSMTLSALRHRKMHHLADKVLMVQKSIDSTNRTVRMKRSLLVVWIVGIVCAVILETILEGTPLAQSALVLYVQLIKLYIAVRNLEVVGKIIEAAKELNSKMAVVGKAAETPVSHRERENEESNKIQCIRGLGNVHWQVCESIQEISDVYGIQLLLEVVSLFVLITTTSYSAYSSHQSYSTRLACCLMASKLLWTILEVIELIVLIVPCATATEEANKTQTIICQILNMELSEGLRQALNTLALHLPHHNTRFTAYGMFNLDLSVISTVTGAVATYLIMIIQFQDAKVIKKAIVND